jgi:hypothetical protein
MNDSKLSLVRYGSVPEVARFITRPAILPERGAPVVVRTHRGLQLGEMLDVVRRSGDPAADDIDFELVRVATDDDAAQARQLQARCEADYYDWCRRIILWNLQLELVDLERTLDDEKLILYVLSDRGPATTQLALFAAAEGLGLIEVQPVSAAGLVPIASSGCGSGGCGCSH